MKKIALIFLMSLVSFASTSAYAIEPVWQCRLWGLDGQDQRTYNFVWLADRMKPGSTFPDPIVGHPGQGSGDITGSLQLKLLSGEQLEVRLRATMAYTGRFLPPIGIAEYAARLQFEVRKNNGSFQTLHVFNLPHSGMYIPGYIILNQDLAVVDAAVSNGVSNKENPSTIGLSFFCEETLDDQRLK